jgi:transposase
MPSAPKDMWCKIDPCLPADPAKNGVVEAGVKYVKRNVLPTRPVRDLPDLNAFRMGEYLVI